MLRVRTAVVTLFSLVAAAILCGAVAVLPKRLLFAGGDSYCFYVGNTSANCREVRAEGNGAALTRIALTGVCGESATYKSFDWQKFLSGIGGQVVFCERLSNSVNYYCSANLPYSVNLYGREINLHVCVKESGVTVASPIIFGGY